MQPPLSRRALFFFDFFLFFDFQQRESEKKKKNLLSFFLFPSLPLPNEREEDSRRFFLSFFLKEPLRCCGF